jgi:NAD(P)H-hydrate epimerase
MQRAAAAAAGEVARRFGQRLRERGAAVYAGPGNNGGDAWAVAGMLGRAGVRTRVAATGEPRSAEARAEREGALPHVESEPPSGAEGVVIDGVLGIGAAGPPTGQAAAAIAAMARARDQGARVVALDVPSGLDATTGAAAGAVAADLTITFGAVKRGLLVARAHAGTIVVVDIGFAPAAGDAFPVLATAAWVAERLPAIAADAHKGTRRYVAVVGGAPGMAGAAVLATRAALASGVGIARAVVAPESVGAVQGLVPEALASPWPVGGDALETTIAGWAHAVLLGPGLGRSTSTRRLVEEVLTAWRGPVVLDADALNVFEGDGPALARLLGRRPAILTPHVAEFARLAGCTVADALDRRFDAGVELAAALGATVLLKGVPTVIAAPDGRRVVSATGAPALATGGSGDVLGGVAVTLLAQTEDALAAAGIAARVHGHAAERATGRKPGRAVTLAAVLRALPGAWALRPPPRRFPVLATIGAPPGAGGP